MKVTALQKQTWQFKNTQGKRKDSQEASITNKLDLSSEEKNTQYPSQIYCLPNVMTNIRSCHLRWVIFELVNHLFVPVHYICKYYELRLTHMPHY